MNSRTCTFIIASVILLLTCVPLCSLLKQRTRYEVLDSDAYYDDYDDGLSYDHRLCARYDDDDDDPLLKCDGPYPRFLVERNRRLARWPSRGGFWVAEDVHLVILRELGINRFIDSWKSDVPGQEDELCYQMNISGLASTFYPTPDAYISERDHTYSENWPGLYNDPFGSETQKVR